MNLVETHKKNLELIEKYNFKVGDRLKLNKLAIEKAMAVNVLVFILRI